MFFSIRSKMVSLFSLILLLGVFSTTMYPYPELKKENSNYYLGVLAKGYPPNLVVNEFKFASARVVSIKDNMVLFGINEKTKLTTFLKNLPFLKEVYVDAEGIKGDSVLKKNPLAREFLSLLRRDRFKSKNPPQPKGNTVQKTAQAAKKVESSADPGMAPDKRAKKPSSSGNMALIDKLIREKAKANRTKKSTEKKF